MVKKDIGSNGILGKIEESIACYQIAIECFKQQVDKAPQDKQGVFNIFLKNYEDKAEQLQTKLAELQQQNNNQQITDIDEQFVVINDNLFEKDFQDLDLKYPVQQAQDDVLPANKRLRPFYFMRKIEKTIVEGGFLTDSLYVPKYVWYQKEAKVPEIDKKLHYFEDLKKEFQKVGILYSKNCISKDRNEVDKLMTYILFLQDTLAQEFNEVQRMGGFGGIGGGTTGQGSAEDAMMIQSLKDESTWNRISKHFRQFTDKVTKGAQKIAFNIYGTSVDFYAKALQELFKEAYFIETWIIELEGIQTIQALNRNDEMLLFKLSRISQFMHEVVILLVLSDLRYLVSRYLKKMFTTVTELHSKIN